MTYDLEAIRAAVAKATAGEWLLQPTETEGPDCGVGIVADNLGGLVGAALPWPTEVDSGDFSRAEANAAAIVTLMNAARNGLLEDAAIGRAAREAAKPGTRESWAVVDAIGNVDPDDSVIMYGAEAQAAAQAIIDFVKEKASALDE